MCDEPETIIELMEAYPEFREIYKEGYEICLNVERVMEMFSKELHELDRNTVQYMIDEMQDTIDAQNWTIIELQKEQEKVHEKALRGTVNILWSLDIPEDEIARQVCNQYQIDEKQVQKYL